MSYTIGDKAKASETHEFRILEEGRVTKGYSSCPLSFRPLDAIPEALGIQYRDILHRWQHI